MQALGRDLLWHLKHACPACTYKLKGEDALIFEMLVTMDGNNTLKRVLQREKVPQTDEAGEPVVGKSCERMDNRDAGDGYYTSRQRVERWVRDRVADRLLMQSEEPVSPSAAVLTSCSVLKIAGRGQSLRRSLEEYDYDVTSKM
jgi:hypothetical protein